ncbi:hypothetical protein AGMMS50230_03180 [Spirochaetia bacterium]|nr:hypothetical protein AGMMS50230_03180 [Spirochaetia bacterium]
MADKRFPLMALLFSLCFLYAQEVSITPESGYYLDQSGAEARFIQRLVWPASNYALRYEVFIEQETEEGYKELVREFTKDTFIEVSLRPGQYRYALAVYDLLDAPENQSDWIYFEVLLALKPELENFSPEAFYLDEVPETHTRILYINGRDIAPEAEIYLRRQDSGRTIVPVEIIDSSPSGVQLVFNENQLITGKYEVYVRNPGGLEASLGTFAIAYKHLGMYLGAAYAPLFPLYGELNDLFDRAFFPLGAELRFGLVPIKKSFGSLGAELVGSWHYLSAHGSYYDVSLHTAGVEANLIFQKWFPNEVMAVVLRAGGGANVTLNYHFRYAAGKSKPVMILLPQMQAGISFLWVFKKPYYAEGGIDFVHWFSKDSSSPGYLRPWIGAGWKR